MKKKLVSLLVAFKHYAPNTVIELEADVAAQLIAEKKAVAIQLDPSLEQRDHAAPPGDADQVMAKAIAAAIAPMAKGLEQLGARIEEVAKPPRVKATKNAGNVRDAEVGAEEEAEAPAPEPTLRDVVAELRQLGQRGSGIEHRGQADEGTGLRLARCIRAMAAAELLHVTPDVILDKWGNAEMARTVRGVREATLKGFGTTQRAMGQSTFADGGALVPEQFSAELVPLLRNATVVRKAGARIITMAGGNMTLPKQTGASTAGYIGENVAPTTTSKPALGAIKFAEKTMRVDVVMSNQLIANAALSADALVRDDMVLQASIKEDSQALFGVGSQYSPIGIENLLDSTRKIDAAAVDRTAPTVAEVAKSLAKIIKLVKQSNIIGQTSKLAFIMNSRMEAFLGGLTTTVGAPIYLSGLDAGMLRGFPVFITEQVPDNLDDFAGDSHTDESRIFFGAWDTFVIAESEGGMQVQVFPNGTYEESGVAVSGAARDQTYVRLILKHDFNMRYDKTIVDSSWRPA